MDKNLSAKLEAARQYCIKIGKESWTSQQYQDDLISFIYDNRSRGNCVVEVGCFRGGLSILLATTCEAIGAHLYTMDIDPGAVASTKSVLDELGLSKSATVYLGPLSSFVRPGWFSRASTRSLRPIVCVLDGDHEYDAVRQDIVSTTGLKSHALAFHDYCLRHPSYDERVDDAVKDHFGGRVEPRPIGLLMNGKGHPTKGKPQPDGHYWKVPGSEGALLVLG